MEQEKLFSLFFTDGGWFEEAEFEKDELKLLKKFDILITNVYELAQFMEEKLKSNKATADHYKFVRSLIQGWVRDLLSIENSDGSYNSEALIRNVRGYVNTYKTPVQLLSKIEGYAYSFSKEEVEECVDNFLGLYLCV